MPSVGIQPSEPPVRKPLGHTQVTTYTPVDSTGSWNNNQESLVNNDRSELPADHKVKTLNDVNTSKSKTKKEKAVPEQEKATQKKEIGKARSRSSSPEQRKGLDLDTRIEMLLKGKTPSGMALSFLQLSVSSDSDEESKSSSKLGKNRLKRCERVPSCQSPSGSESEHPVPPLEPPVPAPPPPDEKPPPPPPEWTHQDELDQEPLSTPPSPFLSRDEYLKWHRIGIEQAKMAREREKRETSGLLLDSVESALQSFQGKHLKELHQSDVEHKVNKCDNFWTAKPLDLFENSGYYSPQHSTSDSEIALKPESRKSTPLQDERNSCSERDDDDDRMSLSSLSSGGEKIVEHQEAPVMRADGVASTQVTTFPTYPVGTVQGPYPTIPFPMPAAYFPPGAPRPPYLNTLYTSDPYTWRAAMPGYPVPPGVPPTPYPPQYLPPMSGFPSYPPLGAPPMPYGYSGLHTQKPPQPLNDPQAQTIQ